MTNKSMNNRLTVIILTFNEERHIKRCIESIRPLAEQIFIVDSSSTDQTVKIARSLGAQAYINPWVNYASQFNWALDNVPVSGDWVMRLDADEVVSQELARILNKGMSSYAVNVTGLTVNRQIYFLGKWIRHGGIYPLRMLRIWRTGHGRCENRWMDEHIVVKGEIAHIDADIADINLNNITWWTDKHNHYASREAVDLLNLEYDFMPHDSVASLRGNKQAGVKRWVKEVMYARLPGGYRAFVYFLYRYVIRFGFLDGQAGTAFHFLQGFWYRYLVDAKVAEVKRCMSETGLDVKSAIQRVLGITV
jgi:glycosyltransferase involved in cell wall biosynthesis